MDFIWRCLTNTWSELQIANLQCKNVLFFKCASHLYLPIRRSRMWSKTSGSTLALFLLPFLKKWNVKLLILKEFLQVFYVMAERFKQPIILKKIHSLQVTDLAVFMNVISDVILLTIIFINASYLLDFNLLFVVFPYNNNASFYWEATLTDTQYDKKN